MLGWAKNIFNAAFYITNLKQKYYKTLVRVFHKNVKNKVKI